MNMRSLLAAAGVAGAMICAPVAAAQITYEPAPWIRVTTTSGCTFFAYDYDDPGGAWYHSAKWTWTGACTNGVATGAGELTSPQTSNDGGTYTTGDRGTMVNGFFNGRVEELYNGKMLSQYHWQKFEMGCGTAERFVACEPYAGSKPPAPQAATPPASVPPNAPTPQVLAKSDWEVIRKDLNLSPEDRIFAVLSELATTGKIDLVQQANIILARRYPNSPLLPVALTILQTLNRGEDWPPKDQPKTASAPTPAPAATATASMVTPSTGALGVEDIRRMAEAEFGAAKDVTGASAVKLYEITLVRGGFNIPIQFEVSASGNFVWLSATVGPGNVAPDKAAIALKRIAKIQPTMIWDTGSKLRFGFAMENRGVTQAVIKAHMERLANDIADNSDVWK